MYMQSVDWKKFRAWLENSPWDLMLFIAGSMCYIKLHCLCSRKPGFTYVGCVCSKEKGSGNRPCLMAGQVWVTHSHPCHSQLLLRQDFMNRHCCSVAKHHELQHARLPCPSLSPGVCSNSCPLSQWCYLTILSSVALFSFCLESFPASGSFPMNWLWIRCPKYWSFNFSISPSNGYSGLISFRIDWFDLLAVQGTRKHLLQHHSSKASILGTQPSLWYNSHIHTWPLEKP